MPASASSRRWAANLRLTLAALAAAVLLTPSPPALGQAAPAPPPRVPPAGPAPAPAPGPAPAPPGPVPAVPAAPDTSLAVQRISLRFADGAATAVVAEGASLRAVAELGFARSGMVRGEWRVVEPAFLRGGGAGRVLAVVQQPLASPGSGYQRLVSPPLPTLQPGLHLVAFAVTEPAAVIEVPVLRYMVRAAPGTALETAVAPLVARGPVAGGPLTPASVFTWVPVAGAEAYQLSFYASGAEEPVAGKLVPADRNRLSPSAMTLEHLEHGRRYAWQLEALDRDGRVIARSPRHDVHVP